MTQTTTFPALNAPAAPAPRTGFLDRLLRDTGYTLSALPIGILTFSVVVAGLSAGLGLVVVWVGVPLLVGTLFAARAFAHLERIRLRSMLGREAPTPEYVVARDEAGPVRRLLTPLRDPQSWIDAAWGLVAFVTSIVAFVVTVTWWALAAGGLTYWFWEQWLPEDDADSKTLAELIGWDAGTEVWLYLGIGAVALLTLPLVIRAVTTMHAGTSEAMLSGRAYLQARRDS